MTDTKFIDIENKQNNLAELPYNNSIHTFKRLFSFKGRIRRSEFCLTYIVCFIVDIIFGSLGENENPLALLYCILFPITRWIIFAQGAKRCHDRGNSGWYLFIPGYILWMFFAGGDSGLNKYGTDPKQSWDEQIKDMSWYKTE